MMQAVVHQGSRQPSPAPTAASVNQYQNVLAAAKTILEDLTVKQYKHRQASARGAHGRPHHSNTKRRKWRMCRAIICNGGCNLASGSKAMPGMPGGQPPDSPGGAVSPLTPLGPCLRQSDSDRLPAAPHSGSTRAGAGKRLYSGEPM